MKRTNRELSRSRTGRTQRFRPNFDGLEVKCLLSMGPVGGGRPLLFDIQPLAQQTPTITVNPVNITYGTALNNSQLSGTATVPSGGGTIDVPGVFTYTSAAGTVLGAGDGQSEDVTFTPDDTVNYSTATGTVVVNVAKGTPSLAINPVNITYGTALSNNQLTGSATYTVNGSPFTVLGVFTYTSAAGKVLGAGDNQSEDVTFTPNDTTNYNVATGTEVVNVAKGTPSLAVNPVNITYGTALSNNQLTGSATYTVNGSPFTVLGVFTYTSAAGTLLGGGNGQSVGVTFTPGDTTNYNVATGPVTVNVAKATPVITVTGVTTVYSGANSSHPASGTAFGVLSPPENLTSLLHLSYVNLSTGVVSTTAPVHVGTYGVLSSFDGNANYQTIASQDTGQKVVILPAPASFVGVSNPIITVGTILTTITGVMASDVEIPTGTVSAQFEGAVYSSPIRSDGSFTILVPTAKLRPGFHEAILFYRGNGDLASGTTTTNVTLKLGVSSLVNNNIAYSEGSVVPISLLIVDVRNKRYRSNRRILTAVGISSASDPNTILPLPAGSPNGGRFNSDRARVRFSYRLKTAGLTAGTYLLYFKSNDDPTLHSVPFIIGGAVAARV